MSTSLFLNNISFFSTEIGQSLAYIEQFKKGIIHFLYQSIFPYVSVNSICISINFFIKKLGASQTPSFSPLFKYWFFKLGKFF